VYGFLIKENRLNTLECNPVQGIRHNVHEKFGLAAIFHVLVEFIIEASRVPAVILYRKPLITKSMGSAGTPEG
jgi:hypothetical protein